VKRKKLSSLVTIFLIHRPICFDLWTPKSPRIVFVPCVVRIYDVVTINEKDNTIESENHFVISSSSTFDLWRIDRDHLHQMSSPYV
jgi:hypothetical protein